MAWTVQGNLRGPEGPEGPEGPQGPAGQDGAGIEISGSVPTYADLPTDLGPGDAGNGYLTQDEGLLYIWDGTSFPPEADGVEFRGPQGPEGPQGIQGIQGVQGIQGIQGATGNTGEAGESATVTVGTTTTGAAGTDAVVTNTGTESDAVLNFTIPRGATGTAGAPGTPGTTWFFGTGAPGTVPGSIPGDAYLDMADGTVYRLV